MRITVRSDLKKVEKNLKKHKRQIPYAASLALNDTAFGLQDELNASTVRYMDRPIPFTKKSMRVGRANKRNLMARVWVDGKRWKYLEKIVFGSGGQPRPVPVQARLNGYGNLSRNYVNVRKNNRKYFSGPPKQGGQAGLYERQGRGGRGGLKMHVAYERSTRHGRSWPYFMVAQGYVRRNFVKFMGKRMRYAIATAR